MTGGGTLEEKKYFVLASRWKNCINKERKSNSMDIMLQDHDATTPAPVGPTTAETLATAFGDIPATAYYRWLKHHGQLQGHGRQ
jgi:hypothetical protein